MSENTIQKPKKDKRLLLLFIMGGLGILLLVLGGIGASRDEKSTKNDSERHTERDASLYAAEVEAQIESICSEVYGAGNVRVAVTLRGGYRTVYASDAQSTSGGYKSNTVLIGSGSSEEALMICYENPEIVGIGIVCEGGDDPAVCRSIVSLISATYGIGANKIYVTRGRGA